MIKKIAILLLLSVLTSFSGIHAAQKRKVDSTWQKMTHVDKHRFYISAGGGIYPSDIVKGFNLLRLKGTVPAPGINYMGSVKFFIGNDIAVSIACAYDNNTNYYKQPSHPILPEDYTVRNLTYKYTTLAGAVEATCIYDRIYRTTRVLYTTLSIGVAHTSATYIDRTDYMQNGVLIQGYPTTGKLDTTRLKGHLTFVGIRGGKKVCWYAELGYGFKGLINAGLSLRL